MRFILCVGVIASCTPVEKTSEQYDLDGDGYVSEVDCDDTNPNAYPGADELCDDVDNDCNGFIDEDSAIGALQWHPDGDGDGYGDPNLSKQGCEPPLGYILDDSDCNDEIAEAHPDADEYCDGIDNDCDGAVDEDSALDSSIHHRDFDGDGYGNPHIYERSCEPGAGYVSNHDDCHDGDAAVNPAAEELCDGIDNDCDEVLDDLDEDIADMTDWFFDLDGDGHGDASTAYAACSSPVGYVPLADDCDDQDPAVSPSSAEWCGNEVDDNCNGLVDSSDPDALEVMWHTDSDADGYGDPGNAVGTSCSSIIGAVSNELDCDDDNPEIHAGASETWYDGVDSDCSGDSDFDADADGHLSEEGGGLDCDDADDAVYPGIPDICGNGTDDDCDGAGDLCVLAAEAPFGASGDAFSTSVSVLEDSLLVGSPLADDFDIGAGVVRLFTASDPTQSSAEIWGEAQGDHAGVSLGWAGDVNGDGESDFWIGANGSDAAGVDAGSVYLVHGPVSGLLSLSAADAVLRGQGVGDQAGRSLSALGNGSGVLVGAPLFDPDTALEDAGAAYWMTGDAAGESSLASAGAIFHGSAAGDMLGHAVLVADVDGDGLDDALLGAPVHDTEGGYEGALFLVNAPENGIWSVEDADGIWSGSWPNGRAGASIAAGDLDGDGLSDVAMGVPEWDGGKGAVYILPGGSLDQSATVSDSVGSFHGERESAGLGSALLVADFDGDGAADIAMGAPDDDQAGPHRGAAYMYLGPLAGGSMIPDAVQSGSEDDAGLGSSFAASTEGLWIGAPGQDAGALYLLSWP